MMIWTKRTPEIDLGFLPLFLDEDDPRPAKEQLHENYAHGGGWKPFKGFEFVMTDKWHPTLRYPGDPDMKSVAFTELREEVILLFPHAWVVIVQPDGSHEVARMD